jgi:hypothetical protein
VRVISKNGNNTYDTISNILHSLLCIYINAAKPEAPV